MLLLTFAAVKLTGPLLTVIVTMLDCAPVKLPKSKPGPPAPAERAPRVADVNVAVTCVPVPLKAIVWVPVPALSWSVNVPVLSPWEAGVNVTLMVHELPAATGWLTDHAVQTPVRRAGGAS